MGAMRVRNLPPGVARAVRERAKREHLSLNKAVVRLPEEATGMSSDARPASHEDLDRFFGTWSDEEATAFDAALREQRQIDPEMWE